MKSSQLYSRGCRVTMVTHKRLLRSRYEGSVARVKVEKASSAPTPAATTKEPFVDDGNYNGISRLSTLETKSFHAPWSAVPRTVRRRPLPVQTSSPHISRQLTAA